MKNFLLLFLLLLLVLIQVSLLPGFMDRGFPHLILVYVLSLRFLRETRLGVVGAVLGGALVDLTQPAVLGQTSLVLVLILAASTLLRRRFQFNLLQIGFFTLLSSLFLRFSFTLSLALWQTDLMGASLDTLLLWLAFPALRKLYLVVTGRSLIEVIYRE